MLGEPNRAEGAMLYALHLKLKSSPASQTSTVKACTVRHDGFQWNESSARSDAYSPFTLFGWRAEGIAHASLL